MNLSRLACFCFLGIVTLGGCADPDSDAEEEDVEQASLAVEPGPDGRYCMEQCVGWGPDYDLCFQNCHHAANAGVDAGNDGIVSCNGTPNGALDGHTINWSEVDCPDDTCPEGQCAPPSCYCLAEPQQPGSEACCWEQSGGGGIDLGDEEGAKCALKLCGEDATPVALPAGEKWDLRFTSITGCSELNPTRENCLTCCQAVNDIYNAMDLCALIGSVPNCVESIEELDRGCRAACQALPVAPAGR